MPLPNVLIIRLSVRCSQTLNCSAIMGNSTSSDPSKLTALKTRYSQLLGTLSLLRKEVCSVTREVYLPESLPP